MNINNENRKGYKKTKLGWIPVEWNVEKLSVLSESITSGSTPLRSNEKFFKNGDIHWVKTTDLNNGDINQTEEKITKYALDKTSIKLLPINTVLIAMYGGFNQIGRTGLLKIESGINQALSAIYTKESILNPEYLIDWLNYGVNYWKRYAASSRKDPNITKKDVQDYLIAIGSLPEQHAIAKLLTTWDTAIEKNNQLIVQKELRKKWLMLNLLTAKKRLSGFSGEWKEVKLGDVFERVTRKNGEGNTNVVTISAQRGFIKQTDFFNKNIASNKLDNYFLVERGEFCYNKSYSNGYPWGATKRLNDFDKAVVTTLYICFGIIDEFSTNGNYFEQFFEANSLDKGLTKIAHEGGRAHGLLNVTPSDFFSLKIKTPSIEEQTAIAQVLQTADKELEFLKAKTEKLKEQKKGLMQVLLTGKKRLNIN